MFLFRGGFNNFSFHACLLRVASFLTLSQLADVRKGTMEGRPAPPKTETNVTIIDLNNAPKNTSYLIPIWENDFLE